MVSDSIRHILALRPDTHTHGPHGPLLYTSAEKATELLCVLWLHIWEIWTSCDCQLPMLGYTLQLRAQAKDVPNSRSVWLECVARCLREQASSVTMAVRSPARQRLLFNPVHRYVSLHWDDKERSKNLKSLPTFSTSIYHSMVYESMNVYN